MDQDNCGGICVLEVWDGKSVAHAVALLLHEREELGLRDPWAIAELSLTNDDFDKLLAWAHQEDAARLTALIARTDRMCLPSPATHLLPSYEAGVGLVLLALCTEIVRRYGSTYAVWPAIAERLGAVRNVTALITPEGVATSALRSALQSAAQRFGMLGGDFTDQRTNRYYRLLLLQGGVPDQEIEHLPRWLDFPDTTFLTDVLRREKPGFATAWATLESYRRRAVTRDTARRALAACPFFRHASIDAILDAATAAAPPPETRAVVHDTLAVGARLSWVERGKPRMILTPNLREAKSLGRRVRLWINGELRGTYRKTADGTYVRPTGDAIECAIVDRWEIEAEGVDEQRLTATVDLFEEDTDSLVCFDVTGARCAPTAASVRYVIARAPIRSEHVLHSTWLDAVGATLAEVDTNSRVVTAEGAELWPAPGGTHVVDAEALRGLRVRDVVRGENLGEICVTLEVPPSLAVRAARIGGGALAVSARSPEGLVTLTGVVPGTAARPQISLTLAIAIGASVVQRTLRVRAFTAASLQGEWLHPASTVEASLLRRGALRVTLGPELTGRDARLCSLGTTTLLRDARPGRVDVAGYGEPLRLHGQPPWEEGPSQEIARSVVDHGEVKNHALREGTLSVILRSATSAGEHGWLLVWPRHGELRALSPADPHVETDTLRVAYDGPPPRAVAWCYGTACLGASWAEDWSEGLDAIGLSAETIVALVRVLVLPVLAEPHMSRVARALRALDFGASLSAAVFARELTVGTGETARRLVAPATESDRGHWPSAARALLLKMRIQSSADRDALVDYGRNLYRPPSSTHGRPAAADDIARVEQARAHYFGVLRESGALHPYDALRCMAPTERPASVAKRMAHEFRDLNDEVLQRRRTATRLRKEATALLLRRLGATDPQRRDALVQAAREAAPDRDITDRYLLAALLDEAFFRVIQLTLIDHIAFS
jgi:hypothetical protein